MSAGRHGSDRPARIGVLGLARSGSAAAELALRRGAAVFASDVGDSPSLRAAAESIRRAGGEAEVGGHSVDRLAGCDLLVVSPGIPPNAAVFADSRIGAVPRVSELEFAARHIHAPMIAITGTNGKTTTTALTAHLLRTAGLDAPPAGNIGLALSEIALREASPDWVVVEASSFQLGGVDAFAPRIGVVTNLSVDHLDRYPSVEAYHADKARLFANASSDSIWILNGDEASVLALPGDAPGERYLFRIRTSPGPGERGARLSGEREIVIDLGGAPEPVIPADALPLLGEHNVANALAAVLAAAMAGAPVESIRDGLRSFPPLEHRLEPVAEAGGILWINDSKATNVGSTLVAVRSMTRPTVLLLGGRHKGEPYDALLPAADGRVKVVLAYGEAADRIVEDLGAHLPLERVAGGFEAVVRRARELARPGDAVLLSPACASYDMFRDYEERGWRFTELARAVAEEAVGA